MDLTRGATGYGARSLDVVDFAGARVSELRALRSVASKISGNRRVYQQLSWHQRRRTMSHTSHRMPARLRWAHRRELGLPAKPSPASEEDTGAPKEPSPGPQGKMRCRKYRRRARFLLSLRRLRSDKPQLLETHVWHAKRFHMSSMAGGRTVAQWPNDRGLRSAYRAASHASLLHDASYLDVVELASPDRDLLLAFLRAVFSPADAARASVDPVVHGLRRVEALTLRRSGANGPAGQGLAVAPVDLLWRPSAAHAQVWLWCHPVATPCVMAEMNALVRERCVGEKSVEVSMLRDELLTYSVVGPRAGAVVSAVLCRVRSKSCSTTKEWELLGSVRCAASLPARCVIALEAEDPRASFPPKRTGRGGRAKAGDPEVLDTLVHGFSSVEDSLLWSSERRKDMRAAAKHKDGTPFGFVPVICMQRTAGLARGFGSGWDLILPAGWGMALWVSLAYANGGRAAGQRELRHFALESGSAVFPEDFQDTVAGRRAMSSVEEVLREAHTRRPKSKRVNYELYRVPSPFKVDLANVAVLADKEMPGTIWKEERDEETPSKRARVETVEPERAPGGKRVHVHVLRAQAGLRRVLKAYSAGFDGIRSLCESTNLGSCSRVQTGAGNELDALLAALTLRRSILVGDGVALFLRVTLRACSRGTPLRNGMICMPSEDDCKLLEKGVKKTEGSLLEPLARKGEVRCGSVPTRAMVGQIAYGGYSLVRGCGHGSGVMTVASVCKLTEGAKQDGMQRKSGKGRAGLRFRVLFRNPSSLQYRFAFATVQW